MLVEKLNKIVNLTVSKFVISNQEICPMGYRYLEGIYIGSIPKIISNQNEQILLQYIVTSLINLGIEASFHNEKGKKIKIITNTGLENYLIKNTSSSNRNL